MNKYELAKLKAHGNPGKWIKCHTGYYVIKVGNTVYEICNNGKPATSKRLPWALYISVRGGQDVLYVKTFRTRAEALEEAELRTGWRSPWGQNTVGVAGVAGQSRGGK